MSELPASAFSPCLRCGGPVTDSPLVLREVVGFIRDRSQGGPNHIIARSETGRLVCAACSMKVQLGIDEGQESLL